MKHHISDNRQLWILVGIVFLILSAIVRTIVLDWGMSDFNANIVFIASLGLLTVIYLAFQQLIEQFVLPKIRSLLQKEEQADVKPQSESNIIQESEEKANKIVIDYATTREKKIQKNELLALELETRVLTYIGVTMSLYLSSTQVEKIIDRVSEFIHLSRIPDFQPQDAIELPDSLTTTDMMHFGWNIAKPFKKPNLHTAYFLKQVFAQTFRNTEVYTIEKKLRLSPLSGNIKIDADIGQYSRTHKIESLKRKKSKISKDGLTAREVALADMDCEEISEIFEMEEAQMNSDY